MMKKDIENKANKMFNTLADKGKLSIHEIERLMDENDASVYIALGWLLKEDKISFSHINGTLFVEPNALFKEIYY